MFYCMEKRLEAKKELGSLYTGRELQTQITKLLGSWWTSLKDYNDDGEHKDKNGPFDYIEDAQKYLIMAEDDRERVKSESDTSDTESDAGSTKTKNKLSNKKAIVEAAEEDSDEEEDSDDEEGSDGDELDEDSDEGSDGDELDEDSDEDDDEDDCCGCDFVYSRKNAKENKNKGDSCGHETVGDTGRCSKHKRRTSK